MSCLTDRLRVVLVSPELVGALTPWALLAYAPDWPSVIAKPMKEGVGFGLAAAGLLLAACAFCYREGGELIDPSGPKAVLLEWPHYHMLKARVVASLGWCVLGMGCVLAATWMAAAAVAPHAAGALLASGVLAAAIAVGTVALARYRIRELFAQK
jgi:hypothetical protein